jgi:putative ABC transport system substrate-binding protein
VGFLEAFHKGLNEGRYFEDRNVKIEYRWAEGNYDLLREYAVELARLRVDLIVATGGLISALAAKDATGTIPILNIFGFDPVSAGLVKSYNEPGGNITGVSVQNLELIPKRMEMLLELLQGRTPSIVAALVNPKTPAAPRETKDLEEAVAKKSVELQKKLQLLILEASAESDFKRAFDSAVAAGAGALVVGPDGFFTSQRAKIVELAASHSLPTVYGWREYVAAGGLMSYGPNITLAYKQIGVYASRILNGTKPSDLPVQTPQKIELVVNLKAMKALGLTIPRILLTSVDEYID